jgi:hypothetical protein
MRFLNKLYTSFIDVLKSVFFALGRSDEPLILSPKTKKSALSFIKNAGKLNTSITVPKKLNIEPRTVNNNTKFTNLPSSPELPPTLLLNLLFSGLQGEL